MDADATTFRARLVEPVTDVAEENVAADRAEVAGPHPVMRAVVGLLLGLAAGALAALLTPRHRRDDVRAETTV